MIGYLLNLICSAWSCVASASAQTKFVHAVHQHLSQARFTMGSQYQTIQGAVGFTQGLGVMLGGIRDAVCARRMGVRLLELKYGNGLVYLTNDGHALFCGEPHANRDVFRRRARQARRKAESNGAESDDELWVSDIGDTFEVEFRVKAALSELELAEETEVDVSRDDRGLAVYIYPLPDDETARSVQRALFAELSEFNMSTRFLAEGAWHVLLLEHVPENPTT